MIGGSGALIRPPGAFPRAPTPPPVAPQPVAAPPPAAAPARPGGVRAQTPPPKAAIRRGPSRPDAEAFIGQVLNGRFRIDSKIGEGGFGAVFRGIQLATGRKVALKLLHPEMTDDDNLVARFRREGQVLCNLRDAHTITTYDFDQTPDGTLYIAMELLEGKSLHQVFHDEAPVEWRRVFKILTEMCSSLAEAHAQGIVHRDLKPENVYLETRPGNPEFVKILDFGIAKVMRGDGTADPQAPQLTATGQTLGTLEYMSPEQLMGKQLDGRSDVYALGVVAYELITGRLPFPDAKGPAGLITAQLKQTPKAPSQALPAGNIPAGVDQVLLKCLEKDKNQRYADVSMLATACEEVLAAAASSRRAPSAAVLETQRGDPLNLPPPPAMPGGPGPGYGGAPVAHHAMGPGPAGVHPGGPGGYHGHVHSPAPGMLGSVPASASMSMSAGSGMMPPLEVQRRSLTWLWVALGLLVVGVGTGALMAFVL